MIYFMCMFNNLFLFYPQRSKPTDLNHETRDIYVAHGQKMSPCYELIQC